MRLFCLITVLLLSMVGIAMSQSTGPRLRELGAKQKFIGQSHIEVDLGQRNTLLVGFNRYAQVQARRNIDSVLRLFVTDYRKVEDTTQSPTRSTHALFRLSETDRALALQYIPQLTTSFRFRDGDEPVQVKTEQDTLQIAWVSPVSQAIPNDFRVYLLVNDLHDIERLLRAGGINQKLQAALESVRQYKHHDLTNPNMAFDMTQNVDRKPTFIGPGLAKNPFITLQPGFGVGVIRNQWVPSLNFDADFVPGRQSKIGYSVGYIATFFFSQSPTDGSFQVFRNDFLTVGFVKYSYDKQGRLHQILPFSIGMAVHRRGPYFDANTIRIGGTAYQKGVFKVQPELYMNGFFKQVNPGLRLLVGF